MDDPTLSGFSDSNTSGIGNIVGYGGYARGRPMGLLGGYGPGLPSGGWSGGQMPSIGGYSQGMGGTSPEALSAPLQALLGAHIRRMLAGQGGQAPQPPRANFAQMLAAQAQPNGPMGQPQQATPAPFGQPAQFGGQGPPGGGMRPLTLNSPG